MKSRKVISLMFVFVLNCSIIFAGSIDYLSNQSAAYVRTLCRNAATDNADIISYNPAGVTKIADGFYLNFNNQSFIKEYSVTGTVPGSTTSKEFKTDIPSLVIPTFYALYRKDNLGLFASFTIPAGGGSLDYKDGLYLMPYLETGLQQAIYSAHGNPYTEYIYAKLVNGRFEGSSICFGYSLGGAYQINEIVSVSLIGRYLNSKKEYKGSGDFLIINGAIATVIDTTFQQLDAKKTATGFSGIVGLNLDFGKANIGLKYEAVTKLEYKTKTKVNDWSLLPQLASFNDGFKERRDLPAMLGAGISYDCTETFKTNIGLNYFFINQTSDKNIAYKEYDNGYELQVGYEYKMSPVLDLSMGYNFVVVGGNEKTYNDFEYQLDSHFFGAGCKYQMTDLLDLNLGVGKVFYMDENGSGIYEKATYKKDILILSFGVDYKIF